MKRRPPRPTLFPYPALFRSQTTDARRPRQEPAPIPASVSASRRTPIVVVAHDVLPAVVNIQTESTIRRRDRKSTRLNSSHLVISYAVFCLKTKTTHLVDHFE